VTEVTGQGCTNRGHQVAVAIKLCTLTPNICGPSVRNLLRVTLLAPIILNWRLDFWKICAPVQLVNFPYTGLDRPFGLQEVEPPRISWQSWHKSDKNFSPTHRPSLSPQEITLVHISVRVGVQPGATTVPPEGLTEWQIPVTPSRIEPAIFRLVA